MYLHTTNSYMVRILNAFEAHMPPYNITVMYSVLPTFVSCQDIMMDALFCIVDVSKMNIESGYMCMLGQSLIRSGSSSRGQDSLLLWAYMVFNADIVDWIFMSH